MKPIGTDLSDEQVTDIVDTVRSVKKRGSKSASVEDTSSATKPEMMDMIRNVVYWRGAKPIETDEECEERLNDFFSHVAETGELPTVEKMCLALGTTRQRVWEWEQGRKGDRRADMIKRAKEILAAIDAELVSSGKIPQVTYIFRAKNYFGLTDQTQVILTPNNPLQNLDEEAARKRIIEALPEPDETD